MIICICHRVSERDIERLAQCAGASFEALQDDLMVGRSCGACLDCAREVFDAHASGRCARQGAASRASTAPLPA